MTGLFRATRPQDLDKVTWLSHDCWFDLDALQWDESNRRVELPFGRGRERDRRFLGVAFTSGTPPSHYDCLLSIRNAETVMIDDEAEIGIYDLTVVRYDQAQGTIGIESSMSAGSVISVVTDRLDVEVATLGEPHSGEGGLSWYTADEDLRSALATGEHS